MHPLFARVLRSACRPVLAGIMLVAFVPPHASFADPNPTHAAIPIERLLKPDGTLALASGQSGSVSLDGWRMVSGSGGGPRFERGAVRGPSNPAMPSAATATADSLNIRWDSRFFFTPDGLSGPVYALAIDQRGYLYVGGSFSKAGGVSANNIACWDGTKWIPLGSGMNNPVEALAVDRWGNLYAGGAFTNAGGVPANRIARWNGTGWASLGSGMDSDVLALVADKSTSVYAGGKFLSAGGIGANYVARWNGSAWSALGSGMNSIIHALVLDGDGNLCAGGEFTAAGGVAAAGAARWDGSGWSSLGSAGIVLSMAIDGNGTLWEGGYNGAAVWSGGVWVDLTHTLDFTISVFAMTADAGGGMVIGGYGFHEPNLLRWNGSSWSILAGFSDTIDAMTLGPGGTIYVGGQFGRTGSPHAVARLGSGAWSWLRPVAYGQGLDGYTSALALDGSGAPNVAGSFQTAAATPTSDVAHWNGSSWSALGPGPGGDVSVLTSDGSVGLYAVIPLGPSPFMHWDGSVWSSVNSPSGSINALARAGSGILYTGGGFTSAGSVPLNYIGSWNGSFWLPLGSGLNGTVRSLALDGLGNLFAGGDFTTAGGNSASHIAKWDGSAWSAMGAGVNGTVGALAIDAGGNVYAGGDFTIAGAGSANHVARWNGSAWSALGAGTNDVVDALTIDGAGRVYAGGVFTSAGGASANHIARWDGSGWSALGSGTDGTVTGLAADAGGNVFVAGSFTHAGSQPSSYFALWHGAAPTSVPLPSPTINGSPLSFGDPTPNPSFGQTRVTLALARAGRVRVEVFEVTGRRVRTILEGFAPAGVRALEWDGRDARGVAMPAGVYLVRASLGAALVTRRVVLVR